MIGSHRKSSMTLPPELISEMGGAVRHKRHIQREAWRFALSLPFFAPSPSDTKPQ